MNNEELTKQRISERLEFVISDSNLKTRKALADLVGVKAQAVTNWIQRGQISQENARVINLKLGYPIDWLLGGDSELPAISTALATSELTATSHDGRHKHRIDYLDVRAAAGLTGFENSDYPEVISSLYLTDEGMLQIIGKKNANGICIVNVPTDSMEPTIRKGDIVFIDTKINAYSGDGIYAFTIDGALFIKRVQKLVGGGYRLHSDNKDYDPQDITDDIYQTAKFIGRFIRTVHIEAVNL